MPVYTYRREDGSTFDIRQKFSDDALTVDPETGQKVHRVVQPAGVIFKGSGFYVTDTKKANNPANPSKNGEAENGKASEGTSSEAKTETKTEAKAEKAESKSTSSTKADA